MAVLSRAAARSGQLPLGAEPSVRGKRAEKSISDSLLPGERKTSQATPNSHLTGGSAGGTVRNGRGRQWRVGVSPGRSSGTASSLAQSTERCPLTRAFPLGDRKERAFPPAPTTDAARRPLSTGPAAHRPAAAGPARR